MKDFYPFSFPKIYTNKKFSKNDLLFKDYIINYIIENESNIIIVKPKDLEKKLRLVSYETLDSFLEKFKIKHYIYKIDNDGFFSSSGFFNIIDSFEKTNKNYKFIISQTFFNIFTEPNNIFKKYKLDIFLKFSNVNTSYLYSFMKKFMTEQNIKLSLANLKKIMEIDEDKYVRFYDFENIILKKAVSEIKKYGLIDIKYRKVKDNNKIKGLVFNVIDLKDELIDNRLNEIKDLIKDHCKNLDLIMDYIKRAMLKTNYNNIVENIHYAILHKKNNFETSLISAIKYDGLNNDFNNTLNKYLGEYKILVKKNMLIKSKEEFKTIIISEIKEQKLEKILNVLKILKNIFDLYKDNVSIPDGISENEIYKGIFLALDNKNEVFFNYDKVLIICEYNGNYNSNFAILKKNKVL